MKAHLIKSVEVDHELFTRVVSLLQAEPGPIQFSFDPRSVIDFGRDELSTEVIPDRDFFEMMKDRMMVQSEMCASISFPMERETASWSTLFRKCSTYRKQNNIPDNEFVILLTDVPNNRNWFASLDEKMPCNGFIHTADWEHYIDCSSAFPVAYEVVALMLQKEVFQGKSALRTAVHQVPIGCVNDMCIQKTEIILKLRTADICRDCMEKLKDTITMRVIHHALNLMESFRVKMLYAQNFRQGSPLSRLLIDPKKQVSLPDFGNIEIRLRPLEKALYILFLRHPEGIFLSSLTDHRHELYDIYTNISNMGLLMEMRGRIDDMVNVLNNSANEKISRIKRVFEEAIGVDLAKDYYIRGNAGEAKKIALERTLVNELVVG